jgi:hypothetical protein
VKETWFTHEYRVSSDASGLFGGGALRLATISFSATGCVIRLATPPQPFLVWNVVQLRLSPEPTFLSSVITGFPFIWLRCACSGTYCHSKHNYSGLRCSAFDE